MYEFIRAERRPVTREQAAAAVGISRKLAAFHLDKLVQAGVLRAGYGLLDDRRRVGRSPKVYEPADIDTRVSIPERRPDFIAGILVDAVLTETTADNGQQAAIRVAGERGPSTAEAERAARRPGRLGAERALTVAETVLKRHGYEPFRQSSHCIRLRNCPFHALAAQSTDLVCGLDHAYLAAFVDALRTPDPRARNPPTIEVTAVVRWSPWSSSRSCSVRWRSVWRGSARAPASSSSTSAGWCSDSAGFATKPADLDWR
ncbi:MAG TPA: hypothetical protein VGH11_02225 [Jatrophihabitans sp.]